MKHRLAIAAIFKHENPYLAEWIEYHRIVGVEHFFLYDNDTGDESRQILRSYLDEGLITVHPWTHFDGTRHDRPTRFGGRDKNHMAFGHAAQHHRDECDWLMKIDIDEFMVPLEGSSLLPLIDHYDNKKVKGIEIPRIDFGNSMGPLAYRSHLGTRGTGEPGNRGMDRGAVATTSRPSLKNADRFTGRSCH